MSESAKLSRPPLVLLAYDQEWSARSLESILGPNGYAVLRAYTARQAIELAHTARPDLVILDDRLPDMTGIEACQLLSAEARFNPSTPIIVTTSGASTREHRLDAHRAGAWEFLSQPLDGELLLLKLDAFMRSKREADRLRSESLVDAATGLYNMRGLVRRAREISAEAQRSRAPIACVAFAPQFPDAEREELSLVGGKEDVVAHLGTIVRQCGRASDVIGRVGPTDFAVVAPATAGPGARRMMERMQSVMEAQPVTVGRAEHTVKIRAGYYAVPDYAESAVDAVEMILRATTALRYGRAGTPAVSITAFEDVPVSSAP